MLPPHRGLDVHHESDIHSTTAAAASGSLLEAGLNSIECAAASTSVAYQSLLAARRQRGEKRPIPVEKKDDKYFERRKRNNEAAKKSRDARKMREDRVRDLG